MLCFLGAFSVRVAVLAGGLGSDSTDMLWRPETPSGAAIFAACWVVLTLIGHRVQVNLRRDDDAHRN